MAYTAPQIGVILLKADRTMYKIGQIAYENMFAEDNEALDYERDVIFIYKKAVEYADDFFVGTEKLDKVVERLATKISAYDYGVLNPIYADAATINTPVLLPGSALNDLTDVTISNLLDNQLLRYNAATGQWINVGPGAAVRNSQAFTATAGQTVFTTSYPFDAGLFDLYVNGVKLNSLSYTTMGEYQITLNDPCIAGDIVDVVIYDSYTGINPSIGSLNDLTDVSIGALANNQALYYNSATGLWQNGLVFVPYTGATASVDLGEFEIRAGQFTLDTSPTGTATVGTTRWNDSIGSSETTLKGGSVILKNGVDLVARVVNKVTPNTTLTKASYAAVRISGAQGQRLAVAYAQANNDANSADTIGLVTETIATNQEGFIMTMGSLEGINTTGSLQGETWADGDVLYLSPTVPGGITNVKPTGLTGHIVVVGYVEYAHANNGKIYVKTMNGWELDELHNVNINTGTLANGDVLKYNATTQLWENGVDAGGITGTGVAGQVPYFTGATSLGGSNNLFWDNANGRLRINGSTSPLRPLEVFNSGNWISATFSGSGGAPKVVIGNLSGNPAIGGHNDALTGWAALAINPDGGNVLIGTSSNGSQKLQVVGDTLLRGSGNTSATTALTVQNSSSVQSLSINNAGQAMFGTNAQSAGVKLETDGVFRAWTSVEVGQFGQAQYTISGYNRTVSGANFFSFDNNISYNATAGTYYFLRLNNNIAPTSGNAIVNQFLVQGTINQTGGANGITRGLYVNPTLTAAADWRSIQWDNNTGWGLYGEGTAVNYLGGRLTIGETTIGSNILNIRTNLVGSFSSAVRVGSLATSANTTLSAGFMSQLGTDAVAFTFPVITHFYARQGTRGAGSTITAQSGFTAEDNLTGAINNYGFFGNLPSGTGRWNLYMGGTADNYLAGSLGIGSTALTGKTLVISKNITGSTIPDAVQNNGVIQSDVTNATNYFITGASTAAAAFTLPTLRHYIAVQGTFGAGSSVTNQYGYFAHGSMVGATNNYGFYGDIASGTGRWNLYMAGTADNYLGGNLGLGATTLTGYNLRISRNLSGAATSINTSFDGQIQSGVTTAVSYLSIPTTAASLALGEIRGYQASLGTQGAGATITTVTGFLAHSSLTQGTTNYGFYGDIAAAAGRWNIYMNGTADNYLAGNLLVGGTSVYGATITSYATSIRSGGIGIRNSAGTTAGFFGTYAAGSGSGSTDILAESAGFILISTGGSEKHKLFANGNVSIGTISDLGVRLGVVGDTILRGSGATSATTALTVQNSAATTMMSISNDVVNTQLNITGSTTAYFRANQTTANRFVQYGSNATTADFYVGSAITAYTFSNNGGYALVKINTATFPTVGGNLVEIPAISTAFSPTSGTADFTALIMRPVINQTGGANGITRGLYVNPTLTAAADWRSIEWSNNSGWGLYGAGTANNYLAGFTGIGTTTMTYAFNVTNTAATYVAGFRGGSSSYIVVGDTSLAGESGVNVRNSSGQGFIGLGGTVLGITATSGANTIAFATAGTEGMRLTLNRNLLLQNGGTFTDGGQRLQVIGDTLLRGSGATSATTALTVQNSSSTVLGRFQNDGAVTLGAGGWLTIGEGQRYLYKSLNLTSIFTIGNDSTVGATIDLYGSSHATNANRIFLNGSQVRITSASVLMTALPTSSAGLPTGALWNDAGTVKIV